MTNDEMFEAIFTQRARLVKRLEGLSQAEWDTPSLCAGWKVRDVVGHLVSILDVPMPKFVGKAFRQGR
jgi:uncharacterized protein (TIGR03083 family)